MLLAFLCMVWLNMFPLQRAPVNMRTAPLLPAITKDVLPGEGWVKGTYRLNRNVVIYDRWTAKCRPMAKVNAGVSLVVLGGLNEVVTPDVVTVTSEIPALQLKPGDKLLRYMDRGEGNADFWAKGHWFVDADLGLIQNADGSGCQSACKAREIQAGKKVWWFHVRLADGRTGWTEAFASLQPQ